MPNKKVIIVGGPTASGKSRFALQYARDHNGVIINADSMQLYASLSVVTARPTAQDMATVPHALYGVIQNPNEAQSVAKWHALAMKTIKSAFENGRVPIVVGGTGLYLKALLEGLSPVPDINPAIRSHYRQLADTVQNDIELYDMLRIHDPDIAQILKPNDKQRIIRALEVFESTGKSLLYWQAQKGNPLPFPTHMILINPPRERLIQNAEKRLRDMFDQGAIEEVKTLLEAGISNESPLFKAVGVREIKAYLKGEITLVEAMDKSLIATRQYIKRQQTWFAHQMKFDDYFDSSK